MYVSVVVLIQGHMYVSAVVLIQGHMYVSAVVLIQGHMYVSAVVLIQGHMYVSAVVLIQGHMYVSAVVLIQGHMYVSAVVLIQGHMYVCLSSCAKWGPYVCLSQWVCWPKVSCVFGFACLTLRDLLVTCKHTKTGCHIQIPYNRFEPWFYLRKTTCLLFISNNFPVLRVQQNFKPKKSTNTFIDILSNISEGPIDINPALVLIMAWRRIGDKPLSEPMLTRFTDEYMQH